jgi:hypothetical protein
MQPRRSAVTKLGFVTHATKDFHATCIPGPTSVGVAASVAVATAVPSSWALAKSRAGTAGDASPNAPFQ